MPRDPLTEKACTGCGKVLPREAFGKGRPNPKTGVVYVRGMCKQCLSFKQSEYYRRTKQAGKKVYTPAQHQARLGACARYRARIKADPERYMALRDAENARIKAYRLKKALKKHKLLGKGRAK